MTELFPIAAVTQDSPRLKWFKAHEVKIHHNPDIEPGEECPETGDTRYAWMAWTGDEMGAMHADEIGFGDTEDEAIVALAKAKGWRLWSEQDLK